MEFMKLTKSQAENKAIELTEKFLRDQSESEFEYLILGAKPDLTNPFKNGKIHLKYSVVVELRRDGFVVDGSLILKVNLQNHDVSVL